MISQFKAQIRGNTVRDTVKFGNSVNGKPYAAFKVAINSSKEENNATFLTLVTWNPYTIQFLKQHYRKGMLVECDINSISSNVEKDENGEFLRENFFYNAVSVYELNVPKIDKEAAIAHLPSKESVEENVEDTVTA